MTNGLPEDWQPDTDPPGEVSVLVDDGRVQAGFWRPAPGVTPDVVAWSPPTREIIVVLRGGVSIQVQDGPKLELSVGGVASLPAGAKATWRCTPDFVEFWVLGGQA